MKRSYTILAGLIFLLAVTINHLFLPNFSQITAFEPGIIHLVVEGNVIQGKDAPIVENGEILLPLPVVQEYIDPKIYWDQQNSRVIITTADKVIRLNTDKLTAKVNAKPVDLNVAIKLVDKTPYIPMGYLGDIFGIELKWLESNQVVVIDHKTTAYKEADILKNGAKIRKEPTRKAPIYQSNINQGEILRVYQEEKEWVKVRSDSGIVGYIEKKDINIRNVEVKGVDNSSSVKTPWKPEKGKINMVWEYVNIKTADTSKIKRIEGLDVVSPTWFAVVDEQGTISNKADAKYVEWAHNQGYKVWGLISNSFKPEMTHEFLSNSDTREKIINQLLVYAKLYNLDGINFDFENVYLKDKHLLTQFIREATPVLKEQGLVVSIDVTIKSLSENWSLFYDRKALGEVVDYMAVMTYDQYGASSQTPGSVAQFKWVENGIKGILNEVPAKKLLLGLPFYMREWREETVDGKKKVASKAYGMEQAAKILKEKGAQINWDEGSGQYFAQYTDGQVLCKMWIEDAKSLALKVELVNKYNLAGAASWRRGFETEDIWNVLRKELKEH